MFEFRFSLFGSLSSVDTVPSSSLYLVDLILCVDGIPMESSLLLYSSWESEIDITSDRSLQLRNVLFEFFN